MKPSASSPGIEVFIPMSQLGSRPSRLTMPLVYTRQFIKNMTVPSKMRYVMDQIDKKEIRKFGPRVDEEDVVEANQMSQPLMRRPDYGKGGINQRIEMLRSKGK